MVETMTFEYSCCNAFHSIRWILWTAFHFSSENQIAGGKVSHIAFIGCGIYANSINSEMIIAILELRELDMLFKTMHNALCHRWLAIILCVWQTLCWILGISICYWLDILWSLNAGCRTSLTMQINSCW